jgi:ADP-ribose pyrophosphatase
MAVKSPLDWELLDSHYLIRDRWLTLRADRLRQPGGRVIEPWYVFEYGTWVNIVALTAAEEVVMVRQYRPGIGRTILELPGGVVEADDASPLAAARRELLEETGYTSDNILETGHVSPNPASFNNLTYSFLALDARPVAAPHLDDGELVSTELWPLTRVIALAREGELLQALHVSALFFALAYLGRVR